MSELLTEDEVMTALTTLPGWTGGTQRLVRTVPADPADFDELEKQVMAEANQLDHHPDIERTDEGLRFVLSTHSAGGVTKKDIDLAIRIDRVLAAGGAE